MKPLIKPSIFNALFLSSLVFLVMISCQKEVKQMPPIEELSTVANNANRHGHIKQTKEYPSHVVISWLNMQLDMLRVPLAAGTGSQAADRALAY